MGMKSVIGTARICANAILTYSAKLYKGQNFGLSLHLHPFFMYASGEGSGVSAHIRLALFLWRGNRGRASSEDIH